MGYISQVTAVIYPDPAVEGTQEKYDALKFLMGTKFAFVATEFSTHMQWGDDRRRLIFEMEDVKWYEGYDDVKAFEAMLVEVAELGYCSEIMRVGEDDDDIESRYAGDNVQYILYVQRTITIG
jgi:hypothetical protein